MAEIFYLANTLSSENKLLKRKRQILWFLFSPPTLCGKQNDILEIISAVRALLWHPDFLCVSIASLYLNLSDATPVNLSALLWRFVTPGFLQIVRYIPSPST